VRRAYAGLVAAKALIVNPYATGVTQKLLGRVVGVLGNPAVVRTRGRGHATELARELCPDVDELYVFSGDGGFNEVLNGADRDTALGFIPGGGTSVLPRALGLPENAVRAAEQLALGRPRRISVGRVNGRRFGFSAGLGLDAELVRRVESLGRGRDGSRPGDAAFAWEAVRALVEHGGRFPPALEVEGFGRFAFALVANCDIYSYVGPLPLRLAPRARFELGLDLVAPQEIRMRALPRLAATVLRPRGAVGARGVLYAHDLDRVEVRCDSPMPLQADGEDLGDVDEAVFEAERDAVTVLV
jgi:diacylglycerol kinase family enzyme